MKKIILSILVCLSFSCKNKPAAVVMDNDIEQETHKAAAAFIEDTATVKVVPEDIDDFSIKFKTFDIKQFDKKSLKDFLLSHVDKNSDSYDNIENVVDYVENTPYFSTTLVIKNNTANKMTSFKLSYILKAVYADGETEYWPYKSKNSEESMLDKHLFNKFGSVNQDKIWNPKEIREYYLIGDALSCDIPGTFISKKAFERTPVNFTLIVKYKGISVNGEYTQILSYDILDSWKAYQKELGLR